MCFQVTEFPCLFLGFSVVTYRLCLEAGIMEDQLLVLVEHRYFALAILLITYLAEVLLASVTDVRVLEEPLVRLDTNDAPLYMNMC